MQPTLSIRQIGLVLIAWTVATAGVGRCDEPVKTNLKLESFDRDPAWEGHINRIVPKTIPTVTQDFGYRSTNFANSIPGEVGGRLHRAAEAAWYGAKIAPKTLDDKLSATGTFAITASSGNSGLFFGWFNGKQPAVRGGRWLR